jgi:predicted nucleotidyltransferase
MARYRATLRRRTERAQRALDARHARAWLVAEKGAELLKKQFNAAQVAVFGSLVQRDLFHDRSDIDLAAWGIPEGVYLRAVSALLDLDAEFSVDLVRMEEAPASLRDVIEREGKPL